MVSNMLVQAIMAPALFLQAAPPRLLHLSGVDLAIVVLYFIAVVSIGFYLKKYTKTGDDFFLAGREMTAWVAGLSFLAANLGSLELMGWAASAYQYGILAAHWYWIGAIPAMVFLGVVMIPFYYISKTHSVPGYLKLRYGEPARALSAISFGFMTVLMSGINMYSMALVLKVVLGWDIHLSIWVSSVTVALYVVLGGLLSAIFNEVLQFVLIWLGALLISIIGLIEAGGWNGMVARIHHNFPSQDFTHMWRTMGSFTDNPMGIHWIGIVFGLACFISMGYWTTDFLVVQRVISAKDLRAAKMAPLIGAAFKMCVPFIVILPGLLGLALLDSPGHHFLLSGSRRARHRRPQLQRSAAHHAGALLRTGPDGSGHHRPDRRLHVRHGRQRQRLRHGVDLRHLPRHVPQGRDRCALRERGPLVHDPGRAGQHRHGLPGDAVQEHHGLCAGAVQLLHRAVVRHGVAGHVVEARHSARADSGACWPARAPRLACGRG